MSRKNNSKIAFMDESGTPGVAISQNDWLVVSLAIFDNFEIAQKLSNKIDKLRIKLNLPEDYEFHRVKDRLFIREKFQNLIFKNDFKVFIFAMKKNRFSSFATFKNIAKQIVLNISSQCGDISIVSDINPVLVSEINKAAKREGIKNIGAKDCDSKKQNLLQVADYVANISGKSFKGHNFKAPKGYLEHISFSLSTK